MNRDDIIRMAREAGFQTGLLDYADGNGVMPFVESIGWGCLPEIEKLAQAAYAAGAAAERDRIADEAKHILKRAEARGAAAEREACAKICEELHASNYGVNGIGCAVIIRARGEK